MRVQEAGRWAHLEVADHHKACSVGAAGDEGCGVDPGMSTLLQELPVAQQADQSHWGKTARVAPTLVLCSHPSRAQPAHQLPGLCPCLSPTPHSEGQKGPEGQVVNWVCSGSGQQGGCVGHFGPHSRTGET